MATAVYNEIMEEFSILDIQVKQDSILERLSELSHDYNLDPAALCNEWVAFATQNGNCELEFSNLERFDIALRAQSRRTPGPRRGGAKTKGGVAKMHTKDDLASIFDDGIFGQYATPADAEKMKSQKRAVEVTTPTNPANKMRNTRNGPSSVSHSNGATPTNGHTRSAMPTTPYSHMTENSTPPSGKYGERRMSGRVVASLNDCTVPGSWREAHRDVVVRQHGDNPLKESNQYMFQKPSEKSFILMDRIRSFGDEICQHNRLPEPLSLDENSPEGGVFTGVVVCEGEGHLNARSCLLEGVGGSVRQKGVCVKMVVPDNVQCSLFPGQVIAVEGINNSHSNTLVASKIYDQGVPPPPVSRSEPSISGFTLMTAVGPFTTTDNLDLQPLRDLLELVQRDRPHVLILMGPFVDSAHQQVKDCQIPGDMTFTKFFEERILKPITTACADRSKVILIPSQRDIHHPYAVYPQPPLPIPHTRHTLHNYSDPTTLTVNGVCVGVTSTDVLFHLSARTMFKGPSGDRMARIASHTLQQKCYYPLLPLPDYPPQLLPPTALT
ncbi:DNA polymerase alpha subunit B-like isoform X2 [Halichondria panicea]|uniref:DNA polymerase alpha subunit B-like isoform X2 n=1 Tax=Halichondria panicea TaxID=6063 RepID=UPI00312B9789